MEQHKAMSNKRTTPEFITELKPKKYPFLV